jgi:hypothetical protein
MIRDARRPRYRPAATAARTREVGGVGREQRDGDLDGHVLEARPNLRGDPPHDEADEDPPDGDQDEVAEQGEREEGCCRERGQERHAVDRQRGGVIEEALALEKPDDATRYREAFHHRGRGDRVGW